MFGVIRFRGDWTIVSALSLLVVAGAMYWWFARHSPGVPPVTTTRPTAVNLSDPRLKEAAAEANRTWPDFLGLVRNRQVGQHCFVRAKFASGFGGEWLWVEVDAIRGDTIVGSIDEEPSVVTRLSINTPVTVKRSDVIDWLFTSYQEQQGGFTLKALDEIKASRPRFEIRNQKSETSPKSEEENSN